MLRVLWCRPAPKWLRNPAGSSLPWRMLKCPIDPLRDRRGLSLVEVLIALVLLGVAATMLGTAMAGSVRSVAESRRDLAAATTQLDRLEALRAATVDSCPGPASGSTRLTNEISEYWILSRAGARLTLVDSIAWSAALAHAPRVLTAQVRCP